MHGIPLRLGPDPSSWVPNVLKNVEMSADKKVLTATMRKGLKRFDGHPHTADDWMFWYDNVFMDKDVLPGPADAARAWFYVGGSPMKFVKVDDYTFRIEFKRRTRRSRWSTWRTYSATRTTTRCRPTT